MNRTITLKNISAVLAFSALLFLTLSPARAQHYSAWTVPENLGSTINTASSDGCPFIAKNNLALFFASNRSGGLGANDLYLSQRETEDGVWGAPVWLESINSTADDFCPTLATSGRFLYFVSARAGGCGGNDIYVSKLQSRHDLTSWGTPQNLGCQVNSSTSDITPTIFEDENGSVYLHFSSNRAGGAGMMDIYVSELGSDGTFGTPVAVTELNTASNDQRPNIRVRDGLEIFFESDRSGTLGSTDLYSSTRGTTSGPWSTPVNLGPVVNSASLEGRPSLSWDGTELYFMSGRPGGFGSNDIYVTRRTKINGSF